LNVFIFKATKQEVKRDNELFLKDYSEKFQSKEEALSVFIGKREPTLISIETYYFDENNQLSMHHNNLSQTNNQQLVNNAMTMQKALETAYNDWNKEKQLNNTVDNTINSNTDDFAVDNIQKEMSDDEMLITSDMKSLSIQAEKKEHSLPIVINKNIDNLETLAESSILSSSLPITNITKSSNDVTKKSSHKSKNKQQIMIKAKQQKSLDELTKIESVSELKSNPDGACSSSSLSSNVPSTTEIPYYYGNPTVDVIKGFIHIYKDW